MDTGHLEPFGIQNGVLDSLRPTMKTRSHEPNYTTNLRPERNTKLAYTVFCCRSQNKSRHEYVGRLLISNSRSGAPDPTAATTCYELGFNE